MVWEEQFSANEYDIHGQELDLNGDRVGDPFAIAWTAYDERNPAVAAKPGAGVQVVSAWERHTGQGQVLYGKFWGQDAPSHTFEVAPGLFWENASPAVGWGGPRYPIAYEGDSLGIPTVKREIDGRTWAPSAAYLPMLLKNW